jgi:hypothetical protein
MTEDRTDHVLDAIDGALASYDVSMPDAMRWVPPDERREDEPRIDPWAERPVGDYSLPPLFPSVHRALLGATHVMVVPNVEDPTRPTLTELRAGTDISTYLMPDAGSYRDAMIAAAEGAAAHLTAQMEQVHEAVDFAPGNLRQLIEYAQTPRRIILGFDGSSSDEVTAAFELAPDRMWVLPAEPVRFEAPDLAPCIEALGDAIADMAAGLGGRLEQVILNRWTDTPRHRAMATRLCIDGHEYRRRRRGRARRRR